MKCKTFEEEEIKANQRLQSQITNSQPKLSIEDKMFRRSVILTFIKNGTPVNKIDDMRKDLEYIAKNPFKGQVI